MKHIITCAALCFLGQQAFAQTYIPDNAFGINGIAKGDFARGGDKFFSSGVQSGGKIIAAGITSNSTQDALFVRYTASGVLDNSFGTAGVFSFDNAKGAETIYSIAIQSDDKIVFAGHSIAPNNQYKMIVGRLMPDGSLDPGFGTNGLLTYTFAASSVFNVNRKVAIQPDGKILVTGYCSQSAFYKCTVQRFNADGTPDNGFGTGGKTTVSFGAGGHNYGEDLVIQPDGKILVYGSRFAAKYLLGLARLEADGTVDAGFGAFNFSLFTGNEFPARILLLNDGRMVTTGYGYNGTNMQLFSRRYDANGNLQTGYGVAGNSIFQVTANNNYTYDAKLTLNDQVLMTGESYDGTQFITTATMQDSTGALLSTFGNAGVKMYTNITGASFGNAIVATGSDFVIAGGANSIGDFDADLLGIHADGTMNNSFATSGIVQSHLSRSATTSRKIQLLTTGKYLVLGQLQNGTKDLFAARFNADGSLDLSYGSNGFSYVEMSWDESFKDAVIMSDGSAVFITETGSVTLTFTGLGSFTGPEDYTMIQIDANGQFVPSSRGDFNINPADFSTAVALQKDANNNLVSLTYRSEAVKRAGYLTRYSNTTTIDNSFGSNNDGRIELYGKNFPNEMQAVNFLVAPDGDFVVLEHMSNPIASPVTNGFRLEKFDDQFDHDLSFGSTVLPGIPTFLEQGGLAPTGLFKIKTGYAVTGSKSGIQHIVLLDEAANDTTSVAFSNYKRIRSVVALADSSMLVSGNDLQDHPIIMRLKADGSIDNNFNLSSSINSNFFAADTDVKDLIAQADGKIVLLTNHTVDSAFGENLGILRLSFEPPINHVASVTKLQGLDIYPNPVNTILYVDLSNFSSATVAYIIDVNGRTIQLPFYRTQSAVACNVNSLPKGWYRIVIADEKQTASAAFIKD